MSWSLFAGVLRVGIAIINVTATLSISRECLLCIVVCAQLSNSLILFVCFELSCVLTACAASCLCVPGAMHSDAHCPIVPKRPLVLSECEIEEESNTPRRNHFLKQEY